MIESGYARTMARYNRWQNASLFEAAETLPLAERRMDRGAFFQSIEATLNHILWADAMWMSRIAGLPKPAGNIAGSVAFTPDWASLRQARAAMDEALIAWSDALPEGPITSDLRWFSGALGREMVKPLSFVVMHLFNHQTHHRGQVHAMVTAAGATPGDTDLFILPDLPG